MKIFNSILAASFSLVCLLSALRPVLQSQIIIQTVSDEAEHWPSYFMGIPLVSIPMSKDEAQFYEGFPGSSAQFQAGSERIILRRVTQATRKLHPASDCFKGMGYAVEEGGLQRDAYERIWNSFSAKRGEELLEVQELICDEEGNSWSDVSAWYWAVLMKQTAGPWLSYVRIRNADTG